MISALRVVESLDNHYGGEIERPFSINPKWYDKHEEEAEVNTMHNGMSAIDEKRKPSHVPLDFPDTLSLFEINLCNREMPLLAHRMKPLSDAFELIVYVDCH